MSLDLGWTLIPYEAALHQGPAGVAEIESINWREAAQAENLVAALAALPQDAGLLVWCGNSHHSKRPDDGCFPMGYQFARLSGVPHFAIDQPVTVAFPARTPERLRLLDPSVPALNAHGGTIGVLVEDFPAIGGACRSHPRRRACYCPPNKYRRGRIHPIHAERTGVATSDEKHASY